jgi:hypothetical protein
MPTSKALVPVDDTYLKERVRGKRKKRKIYSIITV